MTRSGRTFDAIRLDVDNGPSPLTKADNVGLSAEAGLAIAHGALALVVGSRRKSLPTKRKLPAPARGRSGHPPLGIELGRYSRGEKR